MQPNALSNFTLAPTGVVQKRKLWTTAEHHGPCWVYVTAVVQLAARMDAQTRARLYKWFTHPVVVRQWLRGFAMSELAARHVERNNGTPGTPWTATLLHMQDALTRSQDLVSAVRRCSEVELVSQRLTELAQALVVWDVVRPPVFAATFQLLARLAYQEPLIKKRNGERHAGVICGVVLAERRSGDAISLIGGNDLEQARDRVASVERVGEKYRRVTGPITS